MSKTGAGIIAWVCVFNIVVFVLIYIGMKDTVPTYKSLAVIDSQGLCWYGNNGRVEDQAAVLNTNAGEMWFYYPSMVLTYGQHVSDKTIATLLQNDLKDCVRVFNGPGKERPKDYDYHRRVRERREHREPRELESKD